MRIEMKATGLMGMMNIAFYQMNFNSFSNLSDEVKESFNRVSNSLYSLNGGVGNLQSAATLIQQRIAQENRKKDNIQSARNETNNFLRETVDTDRRVANIVSQNNEQFYQVNPYLNPYPLVNMLIDINIFGFLKKSKEMVTTVEKCAKSIAEINKFYIENGTYSTNGRQYGSNQGSPATIAVNDGHITQREQEFLDIIKRNTKRDLTDEELDEYLTTMNHEGCGYASIVNSVFEYYEKIENGEQLFERKFGFSMKKADGTMNFDLLLIYVYSKYDNTREEGLSQDSQAKILKKVMAEKGSNKKGKVKVKTKSYKDLTNEKINKYLSEGKQVIISSQSVVLYNMDGSVLQNCAGAGHSLSVTGVTPDGKIVVSSWGYLCYIDPKEEGNFQLNFSEVDNSFEFGFTDLCFTVVEYV